MMTWKATNPVHITHADMQDKHLLHRSRVGWAFDFWVASLVVFFLLNERRSNRFPLNCLSAFQILTKLFFFLLECLLLNTKP